MTHRTFTLADIEAALTAVIDGGDPELEWELTGLEVKRYFLDDAITQFVFVEADDSDLLMNLLEMADTGHLSDRWNIAVSNTAKRAWFCYRDHLGRTAQLAFAPWPELVEFLYDQEIFGYMDFGPGVTLGPPENHVGLNAQGKEMFNQLMNDWKNS